LILSRAAVEALVKRAIDEGRFYPRSRNIACCDGVSAYTHCDVFRTSIVGEEYLSKYFWVCHELARLGYPIYIDPGIVTKHMETV
jgi:hypothetical protein